MPCGFDRFGACAIAVGKEPRARTCQQPLQLFCGRDAARESEAAGKSRCRSGMRFRSSLTTMGCGHTFRSRIATNGNSSSLPTRPEWLAAQPVCKLAAALKSPEPPKRNSLTTMGYGDIVPVTDIERIFTLGVALIGAVVFSYCMGTVATLISEVLSFTSM